MKLDSHSQSVVMRSVPRGRDREPHVVQRLLLYPCLRTSPCLHHSRDRSSSLPETVHADRKLASREFQLCRLVHTSESMFATAWTEQEAGAGLLPAGTALSACAPLPQPSGQNRGSRARLHRHAEWYPSWASSLATPVLVDIKRSGSPCLISKQSSNPHPVFYILKGEE